MRVRVRAGLTVGFGFGVGTGQTLVSMYKLGWLLRLVLRLKLGFLGQFYGSCEC